jgi:hypothetical protein
MIKSILILLLSACVAEATITRVQFKTGNTGSATAPTSLAITLDTAPTAGNYLLVAVAHPTAGVPKINTTTDAAWQLVYQNTAGAAVAASVFMARLGASPSATVTFSIQSAGSAGVAAVVVEYSATNLRVDQTVSSNGSSAAPATGTFVNTTNNANELLFGALCSSFTSGTTYSAPTNSFVIVGQDKSTITGTVDRSVCALERFVTSTGTYSAAATAGNAAWGGALVSFEETPTAAASAPARIPSIGS